MQRAFIPSILGDRAYVGQAVAYRGRSLTVADRALIEPKDTRYYLSV